MEPPPKQRSRAQIVQSLLKPQQASAPVGTRRSTAYRKQYSIGSPAKAQVGTLAAREYRAQRIHPILGPLPVAIGAALLVAIVILVLDVDFLFLLIALPLTCVIAYGAVATTVSSAAHRHAKEEIELAASFDRLIEAAAPNLPETTLDLLRQIKAHLVGLLGNYSSLRSKGVLGYDDLHFVRQAVTRYVPDALTPFMALSASRRAGGGAEGESPSRILDEQLDLIAGKLAELARRTDEAHLETLRRNRTLVDRKLG